MHINPKATPEIIITIQLVHLQPRYLDTLSKELNKKLLKIKSATYCVEKPPIIGPNVGPFRGPIDQIENANARYSSVVISASVPGELAIIALPAIAPKKRTTTTSGNDDASPQGIIRTVKRNMLTMYTGRRPYNSLTGAKIILPTARPITEKVIRPPYSVDEDRVRNAYNTL